jgi:hypothetical protein
MQNYYSSLFDIMKGEAKDKERRRIFVYDSIEQINAKKTDQYYIKFKKILLKKLSKGDSRDELKEIEKSINDGEYLNEQKEICDNLYEKIFNRLEPNYIDNNSCNECLVTLDPYDEDDARRIDKCNNCNIINLLPFYTKRKEMNTENALFIYNKIKEEYTNKCNFYKELDNAKLREVKDFFEGFLNNWGVRKIVESVDEIQYEDNNPKKRKLTTQEKILKMNLFSVSDLQNEFNPYSLRDYIRKTVSSYKEKEVDQYLSLFGREIYIEKPMRYDISGKALYFNFQIGRGVDVSDYNFLVEQLLEKKKEYEIYSSMFKKNELDSKMADKTIVLSDSEKKQYKLQKVKYELRKFNEKKEKSVKGIDDLLNQIRGDMKNKCVEMSGFLSGFLNNCLNILNNERSGKFVHDYEWMINSEIDFLLMRIGYLDILDILSDCDVIKRFVDGREYVFYNRNFPYNNDGILIDFEKGSYQFKYLNKLLNLLALNLEVKKNIERMTNMKSFEEMITEGKVVEVVEGTVIEDSLSKLKKKFGEMPKIKVKRVGRSFKIPKNVFDVIENSKSDDSEKVADDIKEEVDLNELNNIANSDGTIKTGDLNEFLMNNRPTRETFDNNLESSVNRWSRFQKGFNGLSGVSKKAASGISSIGRNFIYGLGKTSAFNGIPSRTDGRKRKVSRSPKKNRKVSKSPKKNRKVSRSPKKNRKVSRSPKKNRKVSRSPKNNRKVSRSLKKNRKNAKW